MPRELQKVIQNQVKVVQKVSAEPIGSLFGPVLEHFFEPPRHREGAPGRCIALQTLQQCTGRVYDVLEGFWTRIAPTEQRTSRAAGRNTTMLIWDWILELRRAGGRATKSLPGRFLDHVFELPRHRWGLSWVVYRATNVAAPAHSAFMTCLKDSEHVRDLSSNVRAAPRGATPTMNPFYGYFLKNTIKHHKKHHKKHHNP